MPSSLTVSLLHGSQLVAQAFVAGLWQGTALAIAAALCLRLIARAGAPLRFLVCAITFALAMLVPVMALFPHDGWRGTTTLATIQVRTGWGPAIAGLWAALMSVRMTGLLLEGRRLRLIWRRAEPVETTAEVATLLALAPRRAELCSSADVEAPCVIGFFAPRLLVPESLLPQLAATDLRQIVLHEYEHLRRGDDWLNLFQKIGLAAFPLSPAMLWLDRRLSLERELACDASVVAATAAPLRYARCLTRLAEHRLCSRRLALSLSAWSRRSELAHRVYRLLCPPRTMPALQTRAAVALVAAVLAGSGAVLTQAPQLLSFGGDAAGTPLASLPSPTGLAPGSSAHLETVVYHPATARPTSTMRNSKPSVRERSRSTRRLSTHTRAAVTVTRVLMRTQRMGARPRIVPTAAASGQIPPVLWRTVSFQEVVSSSFVPAYAALPLGDGWLIVQL